MAETFLLVDFENVRDVALSELPEGHRVVIFLGRSQNSIPFTLVSEAQSLGDRVEWIKIEGDSKNNLDFHLSFHLGKLTAAHPSATFIVVSGDKGFDPLIKHASKLGIQICRAATALTRPITPRGDDDAQFARVRSVLAKLNKKSRPKKKTSLTAHVTSIFQKKVSKAEVQAIVDQLLSKQLVTEEGNSLVYHF
jgi:hypothetical protein